jgi:ABC-type transport system involved in multi-copper enzyme maturation permease subunit
MRGTSALIRATLIEAWQTRVALFTFIAFAALVVISLFVGSLTLTDSQRIQTAFLAAGLRLAAVLLIAIHVVYSQLREMGDKGFEWILALGISRGAYVAGRYLGHLAVALGMSTVTLLIVLMTTGDMQAVIWGPSLFLELAIVVAMALFASLTLGQAAGALGLTLGFYLLARSIGTLVHIAHSPQLGTDSPLSLFASAALEILRLLLPNLDQFTQTGWLIDVAPDARALFSVIAQGVVYSLVLLTAAVMDFRRKDL